MKDRQNNTIGQFDRDQITKQEQKKKRIERVKVNITDIQI